MDHIEIIEKAKEKAWMALADATEKSDYSAASVDLMYKAVKILKNGEEVVMNEVLRDGDWGEDEEHGESHARRKGTHYVRGHYSRGGGSYEGGDSYRGGTSRNRERYQTRDDGREHMRREMREMMDNASTDRERDAIRRCMEVLDKD